MCDTVVLVVGKNKRPTKRHDLKDSYGQSGRCVRTMGCVAQRIGRLRCEYRTKMPC